MVDFERPRSSSGPVLQVTGLNVYYGHSHALQGVDLTLEHGVLSVVGRNGMGKTTLCQAIMALVPATEGSIRYMGEELLGRTPSQIARLGIGYVPQGRRLWPSLSVDEHLKLSAGGKRGAWSIERIYDTFPRLAERKNNGGGQLSGGEQQMLTISRALLLNPQLLIMDEPTEGLAPVIVAQVEEMLVQLGHDGDMDILVIEQNIGVATAISEQVAIMVNGKVNRVMPAGQLAADRVLQQQLLGVGRHGHDDVSADTGTVDAAAGVSERSGPRKVYLSNPAVPNRWTPAAKVSRIEAAARTESSVGRPSTVGATARRVELRPLSASGESVVIVAGTLDTKGAELKYIRDLLKDAGVRTRLVDLSTTEHRASSDVSPREIALHNRGGPGAVFTNDRGRSVAAMTEAFDRWMQRQDGVAGIISAGGSGGTAMVTPAMRVLPIGIPKLMISTIASGNVAQYVGPTDIMMMHSVADVQGLNSITRDVLANGAQAMAGMVKARAQARSSLAAQSLQTVLPAIGLTMFGVTTTCIQQVTAQLQEDYDCLVFHATGIGGQSMEKLVDSGRLTGVLDLTTTEVCDLLMGGVFPANEDRFGAMIRERMPYVGACGALDMVNFAAPDTVPEHYRNRNLYEHNPQITLMRTTPEENDRIGRWIGERLNLMEAPVRFFLPEGGVSALDAPGMAFHDPAADAALFTALEQTVRQTSSRQLIRLPYNINDPEFATEAVQVFQSLHGSGHTGRRARK
jgi:uncharacterized protein (UPF0261 family)/ABC-type branched-subunit amino acid transport system ATPase component